MAVALGVPEQCNIDLMTNETCKEMMLELGKDRNLDLNPMKGIEGDFYRGDRKSDLLVVCREILTERLKLMHL